MLATDVGSSDESWLRPFLSDERSCPSEPRTIEETGLPMSVIESLICKCLAVSGAASGRALAETVCLPFRALEETLGALRARQCVLDGCRATVER